MNAEFPDPRHNPDLLAHHAAEQVLLDAWNSGRLPHAWLIGGIPGIGKATLAFRFARFVLANGIEQTGGLFGDPPPAESLYVAPTHPVFTRIASNGHADLLTIERPFDDKKGRLKTDIPVDQVRRIAPFLHLTAAEGGWRVVVVDGADRLNTSGQNAILKILEEPPARTVLLVVTENPGGLLPTIRSRCRKLLLPPLPEEVVIDLLGRHQPDLPDADRAALARLAEGSIGRALDQKASLVRLPGEEGALDGDLDDVGALLLQVHVVLAAAPALQQRPRVHHLAVVEDGPVEVGAVREASSPSRAPALSPLRRAPG